MIAKTSVNKRAPPHGCNEGGSQAKNVMWADTTGDGPCRSLATGRMGVNDRPAAGGFHLDFRDGQRDDHAK